jgi:hypothetical protein
MENYYHFLIETPLANLTLLMHDLTPSYRVLINRRYQQKGAVVPREEKNHLSFKNYY